MTDLGSVSRARLRWRLGTAAGCLLVSLVGFRGPAAATFTLATAPGVAPGRTAGLLAVLVGGALVGPIVVGTLVGDLLYDRFGERRA